MLNFEIHLIDSCNLNCRGCSHFAPLADKDSNILTPRKFESNLKSIKQNVLDEVKVIRLLGGEPLLNPHINELVKIARKYFHNANICIVSNGILLNKMPDKFFNTCKENNIDILITYYNLKGIDESINEMNKKHNMNIRYFSIIPKEIGQKRWFNKYPLDLSGSQDYVENYNSCWCIINWKCVQLSGTKLYCCNIGPYIKLFNKKFGYNIQDDEYLDLSKIDSYYEIEEWFYKPKKVCKYCNINNIETLAWAPSKKEITEWV